MSRDVTFVLLHGAGIGPWAWDRVIRELPHPAIAPTVPGRTADVTPDTCVAALVDELDRSNVDSAVLVMHSITGVLAPGFVKRLGPRLRQCVFISSVIPSPGHAFVDAVGFPNRTILKLLFRFKSGGLKPSDGMIRRELCNDLTEQDCEVLISRFEAERPGLYFTPTDGPPSRPGCVYVKLLDDRSVPPSKQDETIARLEKPRVREIESGHLPMLSKPSALAEILVHEAAEA